MALHRICLSLLLTAAAAQAEYVYRYIEGEAFDRAELQGLRDEGFTSWMAHPSGGKVAVFGRPAGGFLEYDVKDLGPGEHVLYVRCLALATTRTHLLWDGLDLGLIRHDLSSTSLRWSKPFTVTGPGHHVLRLQGGEDCTQWPYIDVILLTTQPGYVPPACDADFVSLSTAWPMLTLAGKPPLTLAPLPAATPQLLPEVRLEALGLEIPVLGVNALSLTLSAPTARTETVTAAFAGEGKDTAATATVSLVANVPQAVVLRPVVRRSGAQTLQVSVRRGDLAVSGSYPVTIPAPATIMLDQSAYPTTQAEGHWTAIFHCSPDLLPRLQATLSVRQLEGGRLVSTQTAAAQDRLEFVVDLRQQPVGRYEVVGRLLLDGKPTLVDRREFVIYEPAPWPAWEPVQTTRAAGDVVLLNGRPFLARMLYHAPIEPRIREQGFNLVQCHGGGAVDPLPAILACLDKAQQAGLYGAVALFNHPLLNQGPQFDLAQLDRVVTATRQHPALWAWDLIDEPEPTMKPEAVQAGADLIRRLDPNHIVWVNLCRNAQIIDYFASQDLWSFDYYPFPALTPFSFKTAWLDRSDQLVLGKKPMGTCLQTFSYNRHEIRMPTPDELRTSAWLHIIHGYKWFGYYSYHDGEPCGSLSNTPELWSYARALNTELVQLEAAILAPGSWQAVPVEPASDRVEAREKQIGETWYVVVVSDSRAPLTVTLRPTLAQGTRRLLSERAEPAVAGTPIATTLRSCATQVWELQP